MQVVREISDLLREVLANEIVVVVRSLIIDDFHLSATALTKAKCRGLLLHESYELLDVNKRHLDEVLLLLDFDGQCTRVNASAVDAAACLLATSQQSFLEDILRFERRFNGGDEEYLLP